MGRKKARDNAFKCVYQFEYSDNIELEKILEYCYDENENIDTEKEYIEETVKKIKELKEEIDKVILLKLKNWTIDRISKIELAILRLATYEIIYTDVPEKVVANEAVELAKTYGNDDSSSFVNGVIAKIIEDKKK